MGGLSFIRIVSLFLFLGTKKKVRLEGLGLDERGKKKKGVLAAVVTARPHVHPASVG